MNLKFRMFHTANAKLADGYSRSELLSISDDDFERKHGFIQWAFPTIKGSQQFSNAPVLDLPSAISLSEQQDVTDFLEAMTVRFLEFLSSNDHWKSAYNHNHLRISRAISSLRVLHSWELSNWFYDKVIELAGDSFEQMELSDRYWSSHASSIHDRVAGAFVGLAIGDALGAPVEFSPRGAFEPVTAYREGGRFKLPAGAWTDDTAMALCLAQVLINYEGLEPARLLESFCDWAEHGSNTSTGVAVGIGQNTLRVLGDYKRNGYLEALPFGSKNDGNGSLMRLAPVACYAHDDVDQAIQFASQQSLTTHASRPANQSCQVVAELLCGLINGGKFGDLWHAASKRNWGQAVGSLFGYNYSELNADNVVAGGYVIDTLHAALWSLKNADTFEEAVIKAVNLGDDADTVGAVAGQLAGAMYGYASVPEHLKKSLIDERKLYVTSQFLSSRI